MKTLHNMFIIPLSFPSRHHHRRRWDCQQQHQHYHHHHLCLGDYDCDSGRRHYPVEVQELVQRSRRNRCSHCLRHLHHRPPFRHRHPRLRCPTRCRPAHWQTCGRTFPQLSVPDYDGCGPVRPPHDHHHHLFVVDCRRPLSDCREIRLVRIRGKTEC